MTQIDQLLEQAGVLLFLRKFCETDWLIRS